MDEYLNKNYQKLSVDSVVDYSFKECWFEIENDVEKKKMLNPLHVSETWKLSLLPTFKGSYESDKQLAHLVIKHGNDLVSLECKETCLRDVTEVVSKLQSAKKQKNRIEKMISEVRRKPARMSHNIPLPKLTENLRTANDLEKQHTIELFHTIRENFPAIIHLCKKLGSHIKQCLENPKEPTFLKFEDGRFHLYVVPRNGGSKNNVADRFVLASRPAGLVGNVISGYPINESKLRKETEIGDGWLCLKTRCIHMHSVVAPGLYVLLNRRTIESACFEQFFQKIGFGSRMSAEQFRKYLKGLFSQKQRQPGLLPTAAMGHLATLQAFEYKKD